MPASLAIRPIIAFLLTAALLLAAGEALADDDTAAEAEAEAEADSTRNTMMPQVEWTKGPPQVSLGSLVYVPQVWYSSETSWWVGGQLIHPFRLPGTRLAIHGSDLKLKGRVTFKGQGKVEAKATLNWGDGRHAIILKGSYDSLPVRFYGLGPETNLDHLEIYRPQRLLAYVEYLHRVLPHLRAGLRYEAEHFQLLEYEPDGQITRWARPGVDHTRVHGAGLLLDYDSRDRKYSPASGSYHQLFALFFDEELGSVADFNNYNLDLRHYRSLGAGHVLAGQLFIYAAKGEAPYWRFAALGGRDHTRAYRKGRYLDRILVAAQLEYRSPFRRRFGYSLFMGVAEVTNKFKELDAAHLQPSLGAGLRFMPKGEDGIKLRFDFAVGRESLRVDLSLDESF